ncbi:MAG: tRNA (N6-isopentenyl adenosine(37)-C2)-methylthiotransferase MiaB [Bacteriovoracaceae bacterium]
MENHSERGLGIRNQDVPKEQWIVDEKTGEKVVKMGELEFPPRKVWIKTFGCQMNYHDSERLLAHLKNLNFSNTDELEEADMVLFNTCAVRDLSNNKFYSQLGEMKHQKKKNKDLLVGIGGCVAQTEGKALVKKYKQLDFAFGTDVIDTINDMIYRLYAGENKFVVNTWDRSSDFSIETKISHGSPQAFVNIIKGCNKYCTYCIVPYTRGKERSRRLNEVVDDVKKLVEYQGVQEVTLLGQNVNSYGKENGENLSQLLMTLDDINGLELIRYTTSHPYDVSDELIAVHGSAKKLSRHLHLPVQSGSGEVLTRMHREYTPEHFLGLLEKLRKAKPDIVLSTDIIVGFVNETEQEYQMTLDLLNKAQFDFIYSYAYSKREKTRAAKMEDLLTDDIRGRRLRELQAYQLKIQEKLRAPLVGKRFFILVDGESNMKSIKKWKGRTNCNRIVHFLPEDPNHNYKWNWVEVEITQSTALSCQGKVIRNLGRTAPHTLGLTQQ